MLIFFAWNAQIFLLIAKKITILAKYMDLVDIFSKIVAAKLFEYFAINNYLINLKIGKLLPYWSIYSLSLIEFKIVKTYIKKNLANSFIYPFKFLAKAFIFVIEKPDGSIRLYGNLYYQSHMTFQIQGRM